MAFLVGAFTVVWLWFWGGDTGVPGIVWGYVFYCFFGGLCGLCVYSFDAFVSDPVIGRSGGSIP